MAALERQREAELESQVEAASKQAPGSDVRATSLHFVGGMFSHA